MTLSEEKENEKLILNSHDLNFIRYFIDSYRENISKGKGIEAFYDSTAILLHLESMIGVENEKR